MNQLKKETNTDSELFSKNQDIYVALSLPNQRPNHLTETFLLNSNIMKSKCLNDCKPGLDDMANKSSDFKG